MVDKYGIIQTLIVQANELADARGVDKCVHIINMVQNLKALEGILREEDKAKEGDTDENN